MLNGNIRRQDRKQAGPVRAGSWAAAVACLSLLASACSGGPAHSSAGSSGGADNGLRYSQCMRSHGITNFPDPNAQGGISISSSDGINPNSPQFHAAQRACQSLMKAGHLSPAQQARIRDSLLKFAQCMRNHGEPGYPDPTFGADGMVTEKITESSGVDPRSPQFQAAQKACRRYQQTGPGGKVSGGQILSGGGS